MLEELVDETKQTEKIAMKVVTKVYPNIESSLIKKRIEIMDKKKFTLDISHLTIKNGSLGLTEKDNEKFLDMISTKKAKIEVNDKKIIKLENKNLKYY